MWQPNRLNSWKPYQGTRLIYLTATLDMASYFMGVLGMVDLMLVEEVNGEARVSSKVIAENTERDHRNVKRTIEAHILSLEEFGKVRFEIAPSDKGQSENVYFLNEDQSTLLLTLMTNKGLALEFKKSLVKAFSALRKGVTESVEFNLKHGIEDSVGIFESLFKVAGIFGLKGNQAIVSANVATRKLTGFDLQATLGIEMKSEDNEQLLTATQIGKELDGTPSAIKVNLLLLEHDYQGKNEAGYFPLLKGSSFSVMIDSGKKHSDGSMVQQLKWKRSIIDEIKSISLGHKYTGDRQ